MMAHPRSVTGAIALALTLAGCTTMIPNYERPAAPVATAYPGATQAQAPAGAAASDIEWQSYFGDRRLKRLIDVALKNNRDLRVSVLNIEQARAQYQVRRADALPTVGIGATGLRQPNGSGSIVSTYTAGLSVTAYELDFFGRVRSLSAAALAQYLGTEEARKNVQIALIS
ncbi:MAG: TolC family protein, partial [Pseudomonadota bacterium]